MALEALEKIEDISTRVVTHTDDKIPSELIGKDMARRYYGCVNETFAEYKVKNNKPLTDIAIRIVDRIANGYTHRSYFYP